MKAKSLRSPTKTSPADGYGVAAAAGEKVESQTGRPRSAHEQSAADRGSLKAGICPASTAHDWIGDDASARTEPHLSYAPIASAQLGASPPVLSLAPRREAGVRPSSLVIAPRRGGLGKPAGAVLAVRVPV